MGLAIAVIVFVAIVWILGSSWFKGALGEFWIKQSLSRRLDRTAYRIFYDLILPTRGGTTQIDHLVVSRFGVFVIETKNMKGWIFGGADQRMWTQVVYRRKSQFQNPLHQNFKHLRAVEDLLDIERRRIHGIVAFVGSATPKTPMPGEIIWGARALAAYIQTKRIVVLSEEEVRACEARLADPSLRANLSRRSAHVRRVKSQTAKRRNPGSCPRCGAALVERTNRRSGDRFLSCVRYPRCKGARPLR